MNQIMNISLVLIILSSFYLLGSKHYKALIKAFTLQAVLISLMPLITNTKNFSHEAFYLSLILITAKGIIFPWILLRTIRKGKIVSEINLLISPAKSIVLGLIALIFSFWFSTHFPIKPPFTSITVAVAFFTLLSGLFCIIGRKSALSQVLGYLIFENGIFLLALLLARGIPLMIEIGVLFDVFAGLIIMTVAIGHISREFAHLDVHSLNQLKG